MKKFIAGFVVGSCMWGLASAHDRVKQVVQVEGRLGAFCTEDARLVPVWHHGYNAESVSGWTYTCKPFDNTNYKRGDFAK